MHEQGIGRSIELVTKRLPRKMRSANGLIRFAEEVEKLFEHLLAPETPLRHKVIIVSALAYFILTFDLIPDFLGPAGFVDDAAMIASAVAAVTRLKKA